MNPQIRKLVKLLFSLLLMSTCIVTLAQKVGVFHEEEMKTMEDAQGRPIRPQTTYKVEGSPYYPDNYSAARLSFTNGKKNSAVKAKLNLYDNTILYMNDKGVEMEVIVPVLKIEFADSVYGGYNIVFKNGFSGNNLKEKIYYQVLDSGKLTLLKHIAVNYRDFTPYGTAVITRQFEQKPAYFILIESAVNKIGKNGENILDILADKKNEINTYISTHNLRLKYEPDLVSVIRYYNSLFAVN